MTPKPILELTWIGKENQTKLGPHIVSLCVHHGRQFWIFGGFGKLPTTTRQTKNVKACTKEGKPGAAGWIKFLKMAEI
jgi:hypothetical protein